MKNIILRIAYDGTRYLGWQKTNQEHTAPSIEYTLESVLEKLLQHKIKLQASSRTDRGVHAEDQIVNFITEKEGLDLPKLAHSLNCLLPQDIRCLSIQEAPYPTFHATVSTKAKQYIYRLFLGETMPPFLRHNHWHVKDALDREKMSLAADIIHGEHDFKAFRNFRKGKDYNDTVRNVYAIDFEEEGDNLLYIKITADNFLYKMARNIVGTLIYVGLNKFSPGHVTHIFQHGLREEAGICAPAHGLSLLKVYYDYPPEIEHISHPHTI